MNHTDEKLAEKQTDRNAEKNNEITSASIKNAHATGDGAVQKSDELLPREDDENTKKDTNTY